MAAIIPSTRGEQCGICLGEPSAEMITHAGGENHDGFHQSCLAGWFKEQGAQQLPLTCPMDQVVIEGEPLIEMAKRAERIERLKSACINATYAAASAFTGSVLIDSIGNQLTPFAAPAFGGVKYLAKTMMGYTMKLTFLAGLVEEKWKRRTAVFSGTSFAIVVTKIVQEELSKRRIAAAAAPMWTLVAGGVGVIAAEAIRRVVHYSDPPDYDKIKSGVTLSLAIPLAMGVLNTASLSTALFSGMLTGALSLLR